MATRESGTPDTCFSCQAFTAFKDDTDKYVQAASHALQSPLWTLFLTLVSLWVVVEAVKLIFGMTKLPGFIKDLFFIIVAASLLGATSSTLIFEAYNAAIGLMTDASAAIFSVVGDKDIPPQFKDLEAMLYGAENSLLENVIKNAWKIGTKWSITNPFTFIYGLLLVIPYVIMLIAYIAQITVAIFRLTLLAALSPFLTMCLGFPWGRGMAIAAMKTALSAIIVLYSCTLTIGLVISIVTSSFHKVDPSQITETGAFLDANYMVALFIGWAGSALMAEAVGLANSVTGSALSNTSVGIMTAGIGGSVMAAKGASLGAAGKLWNFKKSSAEGMTALKDRRDAVMGKTSVKGHMENIAKGKP